MAMVFDNLVYTSPDDVHPNGLNVLFPDGHARWQTIDMSSIEGSGGEALNGRYAIHLWLTANVDGKD